MRYGPVLSFGPFRLMPSLGLLLEEDRPVHLGSRALEILQILAERAGELVEKEELTRLVWPKTFVDEGNIRVHISALRRALGDGHNGSRYIVNIPGRGYRFTAPVNRSLDTQVTERNSVGTSTLPQFVPRLIGRDEAIDKLKTLLTCERLVTVAGSGGIGKTSLALSAAPLWLTDSGYELHFVDLALGTDLSSVIRTYASVMFGTRFPHVAIAPLLRDLRPGPAWTMLSN